MSEDQSVERLSVAEAAERLGVTRDAIHKRISRGKIDHEQGADGRLYVWVDTSTTGLDSSTDMSKDESKVEVLERLIESQQGHIARLERELELRGEETERLHQIVAGLTQATAQLSSRVPELEAAPVASEEAPESPQMHRVGGVPRDVDTDSPDHHMPTEPQYDERSWWRRLFGG